MNCSNNSKADRIYSLITLNPKLTFNLKKICQRYNSKYKEYIDPNVVTTILARLFNNGKVLRTKTQLSNGYAYSLANKKQLDLLYDNYLLPYNFKNRESIVKIITKKKFESLSINEKVINYLPTNSDFIKKYGFSYFLNKEIIP